MVRQHAIASRRRSQTPGNSGRERGTATVHPSADRLLAAGPLPVRSSGYGVPLPRHRSSVGSVYRDRKSTRLNSSHRTISYAVFCLKTKKISAHFFLFFCNKNFRTTYKTYFIIG